MTTCREGQNHETLGGGGGQPLRPKISCFFTPSSNMCVENPTKVPPMLPVFFLVLQNQNSLPLLICCIGHNQQWTWTRKPVKANDISVKFSLGFKVLKKHMQKNRLDRLSTSNLLQGIKPSWQLICTIWANTAASKHNKQIAGFKYDQNTFSN